MSILKGALAPRARQRLRTLGAATVAVLTAGVIGAVVLPAGSAQALPPIKVWLAGDSTMANNSGGDITGWGRELGAYFGPDAAVNNLAIGGRSIQTWMYEGAVSSSKGGNGECTLTSTAPSTRYKQVLDGMRAGDWFVIDFGINDGDPSCPRHVGTARYQQLMETLAKDALARGAHPLLVTPSSGMSCSGSTAMPNRGFGAQVRAAGASTSSPVIDLTALSAALYNRLRLCPNDGDYSKGAVGAFFVDRTHFEAAGARQIAGLVAQAIADQRIALAAYLKNGTPVTTSPGPTAKAAVLRNGAGLCLDVTGGNAVSGSALVLATCTGGSRQWAFTSAGELRTADLGWCADAEAKGTTPGTRITLYSCNGGSNQQFALAGTALKGAASGLCLAPSGTAAAGAAIVLATCTSGLTQQWTTGAATTSPTPTQTTPTPTTPTPTPTGGNPVLADTFESGSFDGWVTKAAQKLTLSVVPGGASGSGRALQVAGVKKVKVGPKRQVDVSGLTVGQWYRLSASVRVGAGQAPAVFTVAPQQKLAGGVTYPARSSGDWATPVAGFQWQGKGKLTLAVTASTSCTGDAVPSTYLLDEVTITPVSAAPANPGPVSCTGPTPTSPGPTPTGTDPRLGSPVKGVGSGLCLSVPSRVADTLAVLATCDGSGEQAWTMTDGRLSLEGSVCLQPAAIPATAGTRVVTGACGDLSATGWTWSGTTVKHTGSGLCLDAVARGTTPGTEIEVYTCNTGTNQQWTTTGSIGTPTPTPTTPGPTTSQPPVPGGLPRECSGASPIVCTFAVRPGVYALNVSFGGSTAGSTTMTVEARRQVLPTVTTAAGATATYTVVVDVRDPEGQPTGQGGTGTPGLTVTFGGSAPRVSGLKVGAAPSTTRQIFIAGDSTVCDQPTAPYTGWGQMLPASIKESAVVANHGDSGENSGSFLANGALFPALRNRIHTGDIVLIQFGHNDKTTSATDFRNNLTSLVTQVQARGGQAVLVTPPVRRLFSGTSLTSTALHINGVGTNLPEVMKQVGAAQKVPVIDLTGRSEALVEKLGPSASTELFLTRARNGVDDDTHFSTTGATQMAGLVIQAAKDLKLPLTTYLR
ncbi:MAG: ricin-type beta-trefoil lectin domain protein [Kineosporiaceae bacterium]